MRLRLICHPLLVLVESSLFCELQLIKKVKTKIEKVIISRLIIVTFFIQVNFSTPYKKNHGNVTLLIELICLDNYSEGDIRYRQ